MNYLFYILKLIYILFYILYFIQLIKFGLLNVSKLNEIINLPSLSNNKIRSTHLLV